MLSALAVISSGLFVARAQQIGTFTPEVHPPITFQTCTAADGCTDQAGGIVLDANYRWVHTASGQTCNPGGFNKTLCPDAATCAANCALDGADYANTYGVTTDGTALKLLFGNGGARVYLLNDQKQYENFHVLNQEFTFDVDVSNVPCAFNGALYFSEMPPDGGLSDLNVAGAAYGTGYCDSQCSGGTNFFAGTVNVNGTLGACCNEMDLWEANSVDTQLTPHPCDVTGEYACTGSECSQLCDPDGCDFNPFRMGNQTFYGPGSDFTVDTTQPFTVVTQFLTDDGTSDGVLVGIKRFYVQNGVTIANSVVNLPSTNMPTTNDLTTAFCNAKVQDLGDDTRFNAHGGLTKMGESLKRGAVLVISLWNDLGGGMNWLDGLEGSDPTVPGALRGPCHAGPFPADPSASVIFSNIKVGDIGSTFTPLPGPPPTQQQFGQCGGMFYSGPTACAEGFSCVFSNPYYSQCL